MDDLCPICGAYWECDCALPSGVFMDADGLGGMIIDAVIKDSITYYPGNTINTLPAQAPDEPQ